MCVRVTCSSVIVILVRAYMNNYAYIYSSACVWSSDCKHVSLFERVQACVCTCAHGREKDWSPNVWGGWVQWLKNPELLSSIVVFVFSLIFFEPRVTIKQPLSPSPRVICSRHSKNLKHDTVDLWPAKKEDYRASPWKSFRLEIDLHGPDHFGYRTFSLRSDGFCQLVGGRTLHKVSRIDTP